MQEGRSKPSDVIQPPSIKLQKTGVEDDDFAKPPARF